MKALVIAATVLVLSSGCERKKLIRVTKPVESTTEVTSQPESLAESETETPKLEPSDTDATEADETNTTDDELVEASPHEEPAVVLPKRPRVRAAMKDTGPSYQAFLTAEEDVRAGDPEMASENYFKSCQLNYLAGCHRYAWHQELKGDLRLAEEYYRRACEAGYGKSCNNLGHWAEKNGKLNNAQNWYAWACLKGHPGSCANLKRVEMKARRALAH